MADFLNRLRAKLEAMQQELAPEAGFDRRAYGYGDDADPDPEDATFEDLDREEESPWRRPADGPPRPAPDPAAGGPEPARGGPGARGQPEAPRPRTASGRGSAAARPETFDPFGVAPAPPGRDTRRRAPSPPPRAAPAPARTPGAPAAGGVRPAPRDPERAPGSARGRSRSSRLRTRLRQPESLRELFLLREVIDRPIVLRRRRPGAGRGPS